VVGGVVSWITYIIIPPISKVITLTTERIELVVSNLATFHGVATAFQLGAGRGLESLFPLLGEDEGPIWFHEDMRHVLADMYDTCLTFLKVRKSFNARLLFILFKFYHPTNTLL
jgi:hypothetical protein